MVIEIWGCQELRFGGPNDEAIRGHPLYGRGLAGYHAHEVLNSAWIEDAIEVNSIRMGWLAAELGRHAHEPVLVRCQDSGRAAAPGDAASRGLALPRVRDRG